MSRFFLTLADGHFGDSTPVVSSHATLNSARRVLRSAGVRYTLRAGDLRKGDTFFSSARCVYQVVK